MDSIPPRYRVLRILAVILLIVGALDPMEGSILIAAGSILLALQVHLSNDLRKRLFITASGMVISGVFFLFVFSSLGGFGKGYISWWWGLLVLPYPVGWMITLISLLDTSIRRKRS
jgi:hypothetical protein